jgi:uncharacterized glyoxalase superfamily protein PhnB
MGDLDGTVFLGVHLSVANMAKSLDFYRRAGLHVPDGAEENGHVEINVGHGAHLSLSTREVIAMYDHAWRGPDSSTATVLQFLLPSREAVDEMYATLTLAGYNGHIAPLDAFWGKRYCEVDDPDGHAVGFHSRV